MKIIDLITPGEEAFRRLADMPEYQGIIQKKLRFLSAAVSRGCTAISPYYLIDCAEDCADSARPQDVHNELRPSIRTKWVEYRTRDSVRLLRREELEELLSHPEKAGTAVVRGFRPPEYCGQVWYTADRHIFTEVLKGGFPGIQEVLELPTCYVTDGAGKIISKQERVWTDYYAFDEETGSWTLCSCGGETVTLTDLQREQIREALRHINSQRGPMKIAWVLSGNVLSVYDIYIPIGLRILE